MNDGENIVDLYESGRQLLKIYHIKIVAKLWTKKEKKKRGSLTTLTKVAFPAVLEESCTHTRRKEFWVFDTFDWLACPELVKRISIHIKIKWGKLLMINNRRELVVGVYNVLAKIDSNGSIFKGWWVGLGYEIFFNS